MHDQQQVESYVIIVGFSFLARFWPFWWPKRLGIQILRILYFPPNAFPGRAEGGGILTAQGGYSPSCAARDNPRVSSSYFRR